MQFFKLCLVVSLLLLPINISATEVIKFGLFPTGEVKSMIRIFSPLAKRIYQQTGIKIQLLSASSKKEFLKRTLGNRYDVIWTCVACYFKAHKNAGYTAIARGIPAFKGVLFVRKDSGITKIEDLKDKKIAAVSQTSVAGYLFLRNRLIDIGLIEGVNFQVHFFGRTTSIPFKVYNKTFDAGVFSEDNFVRSPIFNKVRSDLQIIAESPEIPQFPFAVRKGINPSLVKKLSAILSDISKNKPSGKKFLELLNIKGIEVVTDKDYDEFRKAYKKIKRYNQKSKK